MRFSFVLVALLPLLAAAAPIPQGDSSNTPANTPGNKKPNFPYRPWKRGDDNNTDAIGGNDWKRDDGSSTQGVGGIGKGWKRQGSETESNPWKGWKRGENGAVRI